MTELASENQCEMLVDLIYLTLQEASCLYVCSFFVCFARELRIGAKHEFFALKYDFFVILQTFLPYLGRKAQKHVFFVLVLLEN